MAETLPREAARTVETALGVCYRVVLPGLIARSAPGWGPGPLATERSWEFFCDLAKELGDWEWRLHAGQEPTEIGIRRIERSHMEDAAGQIVTIVRRMPAPVRSVVEARACRVSWRRLVEELPDRAYFSMRQDWQKAVATLWYDYQDLIRRVT